MNSQQNLPSILYGTAWKKERTAQFVLMAIAAGLRGIDTACQPRHYHEKFVGDGLAQAMRDFSLTREAFFLQTKFTPLSGQDPQNIPYQIKASLREQIGQSIQKSLENLQTSYLDSLLVHSPLERWDDMMEAWKTLEKFVEQGVLRRIGLSNCYNAEYFSHFYQQVRIKPSFLQNRFYRESGYDKELRHFCQQEQITYQSFWTISANPHLLQSKTIIDLAKKYQQSPPQILFKYLQQNRILPLCGTTSPLHLAEVAKLDDFQLLRLDLQKINTLL